MATIDSFSGGWRFLSNFAPAKVEFEGEVYPTTEHAYQAAKTLDPEQRRKIREATSPAEARRAGRDLTLRPDWEEVKVPIMEVLLRGKFASPYMRTKLRSTGRATLIEGNTWGDVFWGVCGGRGENNLGRLLMKIRDEGGA